ncbi:MAG: hypothetical protein LBE14_00100 [Treponema sp.]|jgi:hypothetical protein|nr:hypothetical protein [Treponema sp.]
MSELSADLPLFTARFLVRVCFWFYYIRGGGFGRITGIFLQTGNDCLQLYDLPFKFNYSRLKLFDRFRLPLNQFCLFFD